MKFCPKTAAFVKDYGTWGDKQDIYIVMQYEH